MATHDARDLNLEIDKAELKALYQTKPYRHALAIVWNWVLIFSTIYICNSFFHPILYVLAILIIGARMHALAILMHDATHYRFLKNKTWNDRITNFTIMYPIFTSIEVYRKNHLKHHRHLNTEHDPDWVVKLGKREFTFPKTKREFILIVLSYFTLIQGIRDAIWFLKRFAVPSAEKKPTAFKEKLPKLGFYLVLFSVLSIFGLWKGFLIYWIVPYLSTFFMYQYIRSVAEHFGELEYDHLLNSTRTIKANWIERFFLAPHNVSYHLEHHLYPGVPYYHLDELHEMLMKTSAYQSQAHITHGYWNGLMNELGTFEKYNSTKHTVPQT